VSSTYNKAIPRKPGLTFHFSNR